MVISLAKIDFNPAGGGGSSSGAYDVKTGKIKGLGALGWDKYSIDYVNSNIGIYNSDEDYYEVTEADIELGEALTQVNIEGNKEVRYAPKFEILERTKWVNTFNGCTNLVTIPNYEDFEAIEMGNSSVSGCGCFRGCHNLVTIPPLNTKNTITMYAAFMDCYSLETLPLLDTSNVEDDGFVGTFRNCRSLTHIPKFNTSKVASFYNTFRGCHKLKNIPQLDLSACTSTQGMFMGCDDLEYVPALDTSKVTNMTDTFGWFISQTRNNAEITAVPTAANQTSNYGVIHYPSKLKRVDGWDFSSMTSAPTRFFGGYSPTSTVITPKYLPITHFIVNGKIDFDWNTVGQGFYMLPGLDFESIESILKAMKRADVGHSMLFNREIEDRDVILTELYKDCINMGWTITGLNIV